MSKKNETQSNDKESKSSKIIIISKGRLSSARSNKQNYMTLQEGNLKLTIELENEKINKKSINEALSTLKKDILKNSKSFTKLEYDNQKNGLFPNKKKLIPHPLFEDKKMQKIQKIKIKPIFNVETTRSLNGKKTTENNIIMSNDNIYNNNEDEIKIQNIIINKKEKSDINSNNNINDEDIINIKEKDENDNNTNNNGKNVISQNFFNNITKNSLQIKTDTININKSEEINLINSTNNINEDKKKDNHKEKNIQQSEKTIKSIMGSLMAHGSGDIHENNKINNIKTNICRLITENEIDVKSQKNSIKSKNELISESKSIKIDENEDEDDEYEEVDDEYDEKIKDDNNRKINNLIIKNNNNINSLNNNEKKDENIQKLQNEFNENSQNANDNRVIKSLNINPTINCINENIIKMCNICEHSYSINRFFVSECKEHYLCKRCTKNYYEEIIEDGIKEIFCPFMKCKAKVNIDDLKDIINIEHFKRLNNKYQDSNNSIEESQNKLFFTKIKTNYSKENLQLYTKKNVIDINSNKNFFNYNRAKDGYCPFCYEESLFTKTNTHFYKCLNCLRKICRYCYKEFTERHIDMHYIEHCKVYYRLNEDDKTKKNKCYILLMEYFFVFAIFYLTLAGSFYNIREKLFHIFKANNNRNIFKYFLVYLFTIILFVVTVPFIFLLFPYFPSIIAIFD